MNRSRTFGWMGRIACIDLTTRSVREISTEPYAQRFLGGRGIATRMYWETVKPEIGAFDPENRLIFMTGPLVGTRTQGATRMAIVGKSPMTLPEGFCYGNIGGFVGAELKKAGFDGIVIEGRAKRPVYLRISDDKVEICDAASLWGKKVSEVVHFLRETYGDKVRFITTGVAGERLVRTAVVVADHEFAATGGWGAVMGSKNLKAIAISGHQSPRVADPGRLNELNRRVVTISKRFNLAIPPMLGKGRNMEVVGKGRCYRCSLDCIMKRYRIPSGEEGCRRNHALEAYLPCRYGREDEPLETIFFAPVLCNEYSICTFEVRKVVDWLYACHRTGTLTEEETGLPLSAIGTREFLETFLRKIAFREGFGDVLAEGLARIGDRVPPAAARMLPNDLVPILRAGAHPPRVYAAHALLYATEPRPYIPLLSEMAAMRKHWKINSMLPKADPVDWDVLRKVARMFWGSEEAAHLATYEGKALAAKKIQDRVYLKDSLGLCDFAWPMMHSKGTEDHMGDATLEGKIFRAVTGQQPDSLETYAERIVTLQRAIMAREGWKGIESDNIAEYNFTEPFDLDDWLGLEITLPGPDGKEITTKGNVLDRDRFKAMREEYYLLRGWSPESGLPLPETLSRLELDDLGPDFR